jgi:hypothetical protein
LAKISDHSQGNFRNPLIRAYQKLKEKDYVPPLTHPTSKWSDKYPLSFLPVVTDAPWQIIDRKMKKEVETETTVEVKDTKIQLGFIAAKGSVPVKSGGKKIKNFKELRI